MPKFVIILIFLVIGFIIYQDLQNVEVHANTIKVAQPFICSTYDEIVKIGKCKSQMICEVTLKSGRMIHYKGPALSELVPCNIQ